MVFWFGDVCGCFVFYVLFVDWVSVGVLIVDCFGVFVVLICSVLVVGGVFVVYYCSY